MGWDVTILWTSGRSEQAIDEHEKIRKDLQRYGRTDVLGALGKVTVEHNGETRRPARDG